MFAYSYQEECEIELHFLVKVSINVLHGDTFDSLGKPLMARV